MREDKLKILRMLEEGKIKADEAAPVRKAGRRNCFRFSIKSSVIGT